MTVQPCVQPACTAPSQSSVELVIEGRRRDLGDGFVVRRLLPAAERMMVGPFIFFDEMGPTMFAPGSGFDVRPHPHIGLATVTYLFKGEILHRDSLGNEQAIRPGAVNWMVAGRGIVHSERTAASTRRSGQELHGIQLWVALPRNDEEAEPSFVHHPASSIPEVEYAGANLRIIAGSAYEASSPVSTASTLFYVDARLRAGATLPLPHESLQRGVYVVEGVIECDGAAYQPGSMLVFHEGQHAEIRASRPTRVMLIGGAALVSPRFIEWNFVASTQDRIARAKDDWRQQRFPRIPGDDHDYIPLPGQ